MTLVCPGKFVVQAEHLTSIVNYPAAEVITKGLDHPAHIIPGIYERPLVDWAAQFIQRGSHFVDVGAHIGSWTLVLAPHASKVTAFEPQKMRYYQLCGGIALNGFEHVTAINCGLASRDRSGHTNTLTKYREDTGSSTLRPDVVEHSIRNSNKEMGREDILLRTLDEFKLDDVSLIKIDVEGFELEVLQGAEETLRRCRPHIVFEMWDWDWFKPHRDATIAWLSQQGYAVDPISGYGDNYLASPLK